MVAEAKSDTIDCTDGRTGLLEAVDRLPDSAFDKSHVIGNWSIRDCLAHIVGWDAWTSNALERSSVGMPLAPLPSEREINEACPADWADRPIPDLISTLRNMRDDMAARISQLTDEERDQPTLLFGDKHISVNQLVDALITHDSEHASQIRSWRKTHGF